jgi:hypothetical protein
LNLAPVRRPERHGFGSTVIDSMAKRTVSGEVGLNYAPSGLELRSIRSGVALDLPGANALERR